MGTSHVEGRGEPSPSKGRALLAAAALGVGGYAFATVVVSIAAVALILSGVPLMERPTLLLGLAVVGQGIAFGLFALGYLRYTGRGLGFVRARFPTVGDFGWVVGGLVVMYVGLFAASAVLRFLGVEVATNTVQEFGRKEPMVFLVMIPLSFLAIGPGEELLYRGVVQGRLRTAFGPWVAIVAASLVFTAIHFFSLQGQGKFAYLAALFLPSLVFGIAYERTENLVVPILIHGAFNAVQFYIAYVRTTGGLP